VPFSVVPVAQSHLLSIPVVGGLEKEGAFAADALQGILSEVKHIDAVVLGPGMGATNETQAFVGAVQAWAAEAKMPLVLDADALCSTLCDALLSAVRPTPTAASPAAAQPTTTQPTAALPTAARSLETPKPILTPHAGELARLLKATSCSTAEELAQKLGAVVVAKGPNTTITDGARTEICTEGTPVLAKAGTGDVLSGIIGGLLAQGMEPFEAAWLGVVIHARVGIAAETSQGRRSVVAEDLLNEISFALQVMSA
jgi:NAD(P)H-hydrate epimerase